MTHTSTEQPEALMRLADNYADACFDQGLNQRTTDDQPETEREKLEKAIRRMHTRIAELEAQLSAIGAGGVEPLRKQAAAPQAVPDSVLKTIGWLLDDAMNAAVKNGANSISMPDDYVELAAWLAGIPTHPAEGVPSQTVPVGYVALAALTSRTHADDYAKCFATETALLENYPAAKVIAVFDHAATQPAAQGLDAETQRHAAIGKAIERACADLPEETEIIVSLEKDAGTVTMIDQDGNEHENFSCDYGFAGVLNEAIDAALAAQAKQGGSQP